MTASPIQAAITIVHRELAQHPRTTRQLAEAAGTPPDYMRTILWRERQAGRIEAVRGYNGVLVFYPMGQAPKTEKPVKHKIPHSVPVKRVTIPVATALGMVAPVKVTLPAAPWEVQA